MMIHNAAAHAAKTAEEAFNSAQNLLRIERSFVNDATSILARFASVDETDRNCRRAIIDLTDGQIEWKHDLILMLNQHEKKIKELEAGLGFLCHWIEEVRK